MNRSRHSSLSQTMAQMRRRYNTRSTRGSNTPYNGYDPSPSPSPSGMPPVAIVEGDQVVVLKTMDDPATGTTTTKATANFNGSKSHDPDDGTSPGQGIDEYLWDIPGGDPDSSTDPTVSTTYTTVGEKNVTLTVTDNDDPAESTSTTVTVTVLKLSLDQQPETITRGDDVTFTAIIEPSGLNLNPTFNWTFHDEYGEVTENTGSTNSWSGKMVESGTLEVEVTINDATFIETLTVNVNDRAWETGIIVNVDRTTWGSERPNNREHPLGQTQTRWTHPDLGDPEDTHLDFHVDDVKSGPNKDFWYVTDATVCSVVDIAINKHFFMAEELLPQSWKDFRGAQGTEGTNDVEYAHILPAVKKRLFRVKCGKGVSYKNAAMTRIRKCSKFRNPKARRLMSLILLLMPSTMPLVVR